MSTLNNDNGNGQQADINISGCEKWYEGSEITPLTDKGRKFFQDFVAKGAESITIEAGVAVSLYWYEKIKAAGCTIAVGKDGSQVI